MSLALTVACEKEVDTSLPAPEEVQTVHYRATVQTGMDTRATLDDDLKYVFEKGDRVYMESEDGKLYGFLSLSVTGGEEKAVALFEGDLTCQGDTPTLDTPVKLVLVGQNEEQDWLHTITEEGKIEAITSSSYGQDKWTGSLEDAVTHLSHFSGSGKFGDTRFTLSQNSSFLKCSVKIDPEEAPAQSVVTVSLYNNTSTLLRTASIPVSRSGSVPFVFAFLAGDELSDAVMHVEWGSPGDAKSKDFSITDHALAANTFYTISRSAFVNPYFRIKAKLDGTTMTFKYTDGSVQYSIDFGETWPYYDGREFNLNAGEEVWFKGNRSECSCIGNTQLFHANKVCYIAGNLTSLLADPTTLATNAFRSAFSYGSINDQDAEKEKNLPVSSGKVDWVDIDPSDPLILPASTAANCYMEMFMNCTSLHSVPDLPATVLADKCYFRMFYGCTGITSIPAFPSDVTMAGTTNKRRYCFQMFQSCTGITKLTGSLFGGNTTLGPNCYEDMFAHCTGLTSVDPDFLPATTLAPHCYRGMFQDTRFERAPNLPAATLFTECYRYMFNACTQLNYIKCLATTNLGNGFTTNWVSNDGNKKVPNNSDCIFVKADAVTWPKGASGVLDKWTIKPVSKE